jgi:hypothetical protein
MPHSSAHLAHVAPRRGRLARPTSPGFRRHAGRHGGALSRGDKQKAACIDERFATVDEWKRLIRRQAGFFGFDPIRGITARFVVPALVANAPGPT